MINQIIALLIFCSVSSVVKGQIQNSGEKKILHLKFPYEVVLRTSVQVNNVLIIVDTDNDGVLDEFDKEINSPRGFPVDVCGVSKDSDGDGCLDFEDPQPLSSIIIPIENCENVRRAILLEICKGIKPDRAKADWCIPGIYFDYASSEITYDMQSRLQAIYEIMQRFSLINMQLTAYISEKNEKQFPELGYERLNTILQFLIEKGISEDRIIINSEIQLSSDVDLRGDNYDIINRFVTFKVVY